MGKSQSRAEGCGVCPAAQGSVRCLVDSSLVPFRAVCWQIWTDSHGGYFLGASWKCVFFSNILIIVAGWAAGGSASCAACFHCAIGFAAEAARQLFLCHFVCAAMLRALRQGWISYSAVP